jgi:nucleotide-binding universal stress UspA family protein
MKLEKILVPLDGSKLAEAALDEAVDLAAGAPVTYMLIRAAEAHALPVADPMQAQVKVVREAEEYLGAVRDRLIERRITNVVTGVWYGPAAATIVEAAHAKKVDLIVMSTHGRSGLGRLILGSVAEAVLRGTTIPVLIVRAHDAPVETPAGQAEARSARAIGDVALSSTRKGIVP